MRSKLEIQSDGVRKATPSSDQMRAQVAVLNLDKIHFKLKTVTKDREDYYIMIKESIRQRDITL